MKKLAYGASVPLLVSSREAARMLSISERTLWQLVHDGHLPSVKLRRATRYAVDDLKAFIERQRQQRGHHDEQ